MEYIRKAYGVPARRGARVKFTDASKAVRGTVVGSRGHYLRVKWDVSGFVQTMHPTWMLIYLDKS
jgi:hypothetical protein